MEQAFRDIVLGKRSGVAAGLARCGLRAASIPYAAATTLRNLAFEKQWKQTSHAEIPVVSIGNLTTGGTGKTPVVEYVGRFLRDEGLRVAILSRGYGAADGPNDEALLLEENLPDVPHLQDPDRVRLARIAAVELESQVLVLDDGFQHRRLHRDLDVVLLDATCPWGGGWQLPGGLLRESVRGLGRADAVLLTRCDALDRSQRDEIVRRVRSLAPRAVLAEVRFVPTCFVQSDGGRLGADQMRDRPVLAFCGIGNPDGFWNTIERLSASTVDRRTFPDHHGYTRADVDELKRWAKTSSAQAVLTTQKDLVKIRLNELASLPLYAVKIDAQFDAGENEFHQLLRRVIR